MTLKMDERISGVLLPSYHKNDKDDIQNRPNYFDDFMGQKGVIELLRVAVSSAKKRHAILEHVYLTGGPGLGKTTIAQMIANEMGVNIIEKTGPLLKQPQEMKTLLLSLREGDMLFIDEIHAVDNRVTEVLYPAMDDYKVDGEKIKRFTLVGATTIQGMSEKPFLNRFGIHAHLKIYNIDDITNIIKRSAMLSDFYIDDDSAKRIASCSRQTPRTANTLLRRTVDCVVAYDDEYEYKNHSRIRITMEDVERMLKINGIDENGLNELDRAYIDLITNDFPKAVSLKRIQGVLNTDEKTILRVIEPYILQHLGLVTINSRGRTLTQKGINSKKYGIVQTIRNNHGGIIPNSGRDNPNPKVVDLDFTLPNKMFGRR